MAEFFLKKGCQVVIAGKLKPGRIEGSFWREPGISDEDGLVGLDEKSGMAQVGDLHFRPFKLLKARIAHTTRNEACPSRRARNQRACDWDSRLCMLLGCERRLYICLGDELNRA